MSLLLAQQTELDKPFRFQNHLSNTIEIKPDSEIALNHVTINRATFYQFEEDKILYVCHTNQVPDSFPYPFYYIYPDAAEYDESSEDMSLSLTKETFNPFLNYPQPIIVKAGVYSVETLAAYIQTRLNIPTIELGGDFYPSKKWTVTPNNNAAGEMDGFKFDFEQAFVGNLQDHTFTAFETSTILTPIIPEYHDTGNVPDYWISTDKYSATADTHQLNITPTKDAKWTASGTFNYFLSTSSGVVTSSKVSDWNTSQDKFKQVPIHFGVSGITKKPAVFGISRFTDGQKFCGVVRTLAGSGNRNIPYFDMSEMNLVLGLSEPSVGIAQQFFYDYCCVIDATDELHLFQMYVDIKSSNRPVFRMKEIKYWEIANIGHSDFTAPLKINETPSAGPPEVLRYNCISIDLNNTQVTVLASEYNDSKFSNEKIVSHHQLKPLHSCNQQLVPKFNLYRSGDTLSLLLPTFSKYQRDGVSTPPYFQARPVATKSIDNGLFDYPSPFNCEDGNTLWQMLYALQVGKMVTNDNFEALDIFYGTTKTVTNTIFDKENGMPYFKYQYYQPDIDAQNAVLALEDKIWGEVEQATVADITETNFWWAFKDNGVQGSLGDTYIYDYMIAPYQATGVPNDRALFADDYLIAGNSKIFNVFADMNRHLGLVLPEEAMVDLTTKVETVDVTTKQLIGNTELAGTSDDLLYIRLNIGNVLTANGMTNSLSRILSPIVATNGASLTGVRSYLPTEKMYMKLNNPSSIYLNNFTVEIVNGSEKYATELGSRTSASFHIRESK